MTEDELKEWYFSWIQDILYSNPPFRGVTYNKLLLRLHKIPFSYSITRDANRADDGVSLRNRFAYVNNLDGYSTSAIVETGMCSVLEMMVALAIRCEDIMQSPFVEDQTSRWFWSMVDSLGLGNMTDRMYDEDTVDQIIYTFLDRNYLPTGEGGLFTIPNCPEDLRDVEIWYQMNWYLCNQCN